MSRTVGKWTLLKLAVGAVVLAAGWYFLAPTQLGGSNTYLSTYGTSMQPAFHTGDLAILRAASTYQVGEVVGYRNMSLGGKVVMHRIIAIHDGLYTFKGDNNHFVDSFHPDRAELVGRLWVHIPAAGRYLLFLHGPRLFMVLGLIALVFFGFWLMSSRERLRGGRRGEVPGVSAPRAGLPSLGALPLFAVGALAAFGALAFAGYKSPLTRSGVQQDLYTQSGHFDYSAKLIRPSTVYGGSSAATGQPLYLGLVRQASVGFGYHFVSTAPHAVSGKLSLSATLAAPDGWRRTLTLAPTESFAGDKASISGQLDLPTLISLLAAVEKLSDTAGQTDTVTVTPDVHVVGMVNGRPLNQSFTPALPFNLTTYELDLQPGNASGPSSSTLLTQSTTGSGPTLVPNSFALLGAQLSVSFARRIGVFGAGASLVILIAGLLMALRRRPQREGDAITKRFDDIIVSVTRPPEGLQLPTVAVGSIDGLVRIAEQAARMVLHLRYGDTDIFFVEDAGLVYVYETTSASAVPTLHAQAAPASG